jgi:hypothetical protein
MGGIAHEDLPVTPQRSRQGRATSALASTGHPRAGLDGKIGVIGYKNTGQPPSSVLVQNKQKCASTRTKTAGRPPSTDPRNVVSLRLEHLDGGLPESAIHAHVFSNALDPPGADQSRPCAVINDAPSHGCLLDYVERMPKARVGIRCLSCLKQFRGKESRPTRRIRPPDLECARREGQLLGFRQHPRGHRLHQCSDPVELQRQLPRAGDDVGEHIGSMRNPDHREVAHPTDQTVFAERPIQSGQKLVRTGAIMRVDQADLR